MSLISDAEGRVVNAIVRAHETSEYLARVIEDVRKDSERLIAIRKQLEDSSVQFQPVHNQGIERIEAGQRAALADKKAYLVGQKEQLEELNGAKARQQAEIEAAAKQIQQLQIAINNVR